MKDPDRAYDEHRQDCTDAGICHFCEGEGCLRCRPAGDFEVCPTGTRRVLTEKDLRIAELEGALRHIADMKSCLLAHAQEVARNVLETDNDK